MKEFSKWTIDEVEEYFHLLPINDHPLLNQWLNNACVISSAEEQRLSELCERLRAHIHDWNEEELKMSFISCLLDLVNYQHLDYHAFFERPLSVTIGKERLSGILDCVIAAGRRVPKHPLFCLHEYKPEKQASNDPLGQVLVAMVAAQMFNQDEKPMYGAYVVGRLWYFLVLTPPNYGLSLAFDATKMPEFCDIFKLLRWIKQMIERELHQ